MAYQLTQKQTLLAKYGGTPAAANVVTLAENFFPDVTVKNGTIKEVCSGQLGAEKGYVVPDFTTAKGGISVLLKANGTGDSPPKIADLYKMCGLVETIDSTEGSENVKYTPMTASMSDSGTIVSYIDGEKRTITGVVANLKMSFTVGELAKATFDISGFTSAEPSLEANPSVTCDSNSNFVVQSVTAVTVGGAAINLTEAEFDLGNEIQEVYATGLKEYVISDFAPKITIKDIKQKDHYEHWSDLVNGNIKAFVITLGSGAGGTLTLTANYCKYSEIKEEDDNGKTAISRTFRCESSAGGDNFEIKYS